MPGFYTVGHSTRSLRNFIWLLKSHGITLVADVRSIPRSRHNPQFDIETLPAALKKAGIGYVHLAKLGGHRKPVLDSPNRGWRNKSFQGYADYMQTKEFREGLDRLIASGERNTVAIMCAEIVPWRCHRSLISDALLVRGFPVEEIVGEDEVRPHELTPFARVRGTRITYPPES